jgi:crotonobetainyl-CoA:carnitine CoA-transferase CaiB-like acyl-CoA transferase
VTALTGLTVIETAERVCGEYAGKLLSDFGAEVIKVERPGGAPTRGMGPFHAGESALFGYLHTNKKSVVLDLTTHEGRAGLDRLLARAHAVIDDHVAERAPARFAADHPHLVHTLITPFGQGAPADWQMARPLNVINAGGWAWHTPSECPPDKPPLKGAGRFLPDYEAGIDAALATLAALHRQRVTGSGQFIDIAEVDVQVNRIDCVLDRMLAGEAEPGNSRTAYDMGGPGAAFATRDGHVFLLMTTRVHWQGLCTLMDDPDWAASFPADWLEFHCTPDRVAEFRLHFRQWCAQQSKGDISEAAQKLGVAMVPVNTAADLPENEQFRHRGFFQELDGKRYPTVPYKLSASPVRLTTPAPALGQHQAEAELTTPRLPAAARNAPRAMHVPRGGPLAGVRVLELTKVWAGPYAGKLLAHLGAEVIKLESLTNLDEMRAYGGVDINSAPYFLSINQEILSAQVNLKTAEGLALLKDMVRESDVFIDNIRPGAMERSGLSWDSLSVIKPDLIQLSLKMWGNDGPLGYQTGYAPCFAALSGLNYLVGHEGEVPRGMNIRYGDSTAGALAALAALAALHHRERTGEGQFIDLSTVEALSSLVGDSLFAHALTGDVPQPDGNYHPEMCPHGAYPCADGTWISIAVADDGEWQAMRQYLALPDDPRHRTLAGRQADRFALDTTIGAATARHDATALGEALRARGVPAFRSASSMDLCSDDWLWTRGTFRMVSDHAQGSRPVIAPSWRMTPDEAELARGAPLLGQHNDYVYRTLLGLSAGRLDDLVRRKVIE